MPPSTRNVEAVIKLASSLARKATAAASSSGSAKRPLGMCTRRRWARSGSLAKSSCRAITDLIDEYLDFALPARCRADSGKVLLAFTLPGVTRNWDHSDTLCPQAEKACAETICMWWSEALTEAHAERIASAIRKVVSAYAA